MAVVGGIRPKLCRGRENKDDARRRLREILTPDGVEVVRVFGRGEDTESIFD
jgi:hypothetical protein